MKNLPSGPGTLLIFVVVVLVLVWAFIQIWPVLVGPFT